MKLILGFALFCVLCSALLLWPVAGRSFWSRSSERGLPRAVARLTARGLRSAWELLSAHSPSSASSTATRGGPAHSPARPPASTRKAAGEKRVAPTTSTGSGAAGAPPAPASGRSPAVAAIGGAVPAPAPRGGPGEARGGPDRIVAQAPKEKLEARDRAGLEKLIAR